MIESDDVHTGATDDAVAFVIVCQLILMVWAVGFDRQLEFRYVEVHDKAADDVLKLKSNAPADDAFNVRAQGGFKMSGILAHLQSEPLLG